MQHKQMSNALLFANEKVSALSEPALWQTKSEMDNTTCTAFASCVVWRCNPIRRTCHPKWFECFRCWWFLVNVVCACWTNCTNTLWYVEQRFFNTYSTEKLYVTCLIKWINEFRTNRATWFLRHHYPKIQTGPSNRGTQVPQNYCKRNCKGDSTFTGHKHKWNLSPWQKLHYEHKQVNNEKNWGISQLSKPKIQHWIFHKLGELLLFFNSNSFGIFGHRRGFGAELLWDSLWFSGPDLSWEGSTKVFHPGFSKGAPRFHQSSSSFVLSLILWGRSVLGC